jgi:hypothetical protein
MTRDEAHTKIKADFAAVVGKVILVLEFTGYRNDNMMSFRCDGVKARVTPTNDADLFHAPDLEWIDPYWNLDLIDPPAEWSDLTSCWMYGTSYNIVTDKSDPARMEIPA